MKFYLCRCIVNTMVWFICWWCGLYTSAAYTLSLILNICMLLLICYMAHIPKIMVSVRSFLSSASKNKSFTAMVGENVGHCGTQWTIRCLHFTAVDIIFMKGSDRCTDDIVLTLLVTTSFKI